MYIDLRHLLQTLLVKMKNVSSMCLVTATTIPISQAGGLYQALSMWRRLSWVCCIQRCLAVCGSCAVTAGDRGAVSHVSRNPGTSSASTQPPPVELPTSLREDFTITEKAHSWF